MVSRWLYHIAFRLPLIQVMLVLDSNLIIVFSSASVISCHHFAKSTPTSEQHDNHFNPTVYRCFFRSDIPLSLFSSLFCEVDRSLHTHVLCSLFQGSTHRESKCSTARWNLQIIGTCALVHTDQETFLAGESWEVPSFPYYQVQSYRVDDERCGLPPFVVPTVHRSQSRHPSWMARTDSHSSWIPALQRREIIGLMESAPF